MCMFWIDQYKANISVHVFATRATPRLFILAETQDPCYWSICCCLKGMTASKDEIYLFTAGPSAAEDFSTVPAIGRPHINCKLSHPNDTGGYWPSCAIWGVVVIFTIKKWWTTGEVCVVKEKALFNITFFLSASGWLSMKDGLKALLG